MYWLDIITRIMGIAGGLVSIYLFLVNRRLSIFKIDEQLEQCEIKKEDVKLAIKQEKRDKFAEYQLGELRLNIEQDMKKKEEIKIREIEARKKYLLKMKKFKWLWSKVD